MNSNKNQVKDYKLSAKLNENCIKTKYRPRKNQMLRIKSLSLREKKEKYGDTRPISAQHPHPHL